MNFSTVLLKIGHFIFDSQLHKFQSLIQYSAALAHILGLRIMELEDNYHEGGLTQREYILLNNIAIFPLKLGGHHN